MGQTSLLQGWSGSKDLNHHGFNHFSVVHKDGGVSEAKFHLDQDLSSGQTAALMQCLFMFLPLITVRDKVVKDELPDAWKHDFLAKNLTI